MPELPEVVVTLKGVLPHIEGKLVFSVIVRNPNLRWPVPSNLFELLNGQLLKSARQRAKYMLFQFLNGHLMVHLGMSGNLKILLEQSPPEKHDFRCLRLVDARCWPAVRIGRGFSARRAAV